jgi:hypothetical protein
LALAQQAWEENKEENVIVNHGVGTNFAQFLLLFVAILPGDKHLPPLWNALVKAKPSDHISSPRKGLGFVGEVAL